MVIVSDAAQESWGIQAEKSEVIHNIMSDEPCKDPLVLITASRFDTSEKGQKRMVKLANLMNNNDIPFIWLYFSNVKLPYSIENLVYMKPTLDIRGYIKRADYLVQLSDSESFCYSMVEALAEGVPVITTPLPVLDEIGINDNNSYIVPFDIPDDYDVKKIFEERKRKFTYKYDNTIIIKKWKNIFDNIEEKQYKEIEITANYKDVVLDRDVKKGERLVVESHRARVIVNAGFGKILK
jgi:glycosyltransferase involved in cell wall biosynthesis